MPAACASSTALSFRPCTDWNRGFARRPSAKACWPSPARHEIPNAKGNFNLDLVLRVFELRRLELVRIASTERLGLRRCIGNLVGGFVLLAETNLRPTSAANPLAKNPPPFSPPVSAGNAGSDGDGVYRRRNLRAGQLRRAGVSHSENFALVRGESMELDSHRLPARQRPGLRNRMGFRAAHRAGVSHSENFALVRGESMELDSHRLPARQRPGLRNRM